MLLCFDLTVVVIRRTTCGRLLPVLSFVYLASYSQNACVCGCLCACVRACARACARACVCVCVCARARNLCTCAVHVYMWQCMCTCVRACYVYVAGGRGDRVPLHDPKFQLWRHTPNHPSLSASLPLDLASGR